MADSVAACAVCLLAAVPLCTQNHRTRVSAPQTIDAVEIEKAAHVVVGLFKSYNHTFKVLHGRAVTVLNETNHSLARCEEMDADIRNFTSHSGASHVVSAVTEALRQAQEAQKMAQDSLKEALAALQNVSLTASSMAALCLNKDDHIKVPQKEMEIIRRPLLWNSLIASNYGARQHFNNLTDVMQRVYKNGDEATFVDRTSDGKWENETRQLWQEALHKGKGMVKTLITPVVECRMTELEGSLMGDAVKEQLVSEQVTAIQNVLSNLEASALQRLGSLVLLLRRSYELLHKAQGLQKQAAEKILSAKSSAMCRFHWRIAEEERCIASLKLSASTTSAKISELQVRLDAVVSAAASAKKGVEEAQNITKQQGQAASSTILKCEEVRAVVAHTTKAISTAESSLITARRAAGLAQRAYEVTGSAVEEIDKALVSIKEAQNGYKDTSRAQRNVDESTAATAASLDEVKRISRQPVWPVSYRGYEASHRSCESFNRANAHANEHDEQLLWALGLFEEGRFVSSDLNQLVNNVTKLKELSGLAEAKLQAATLSTELAVKHVDAAKQHVQLALEDSRDGERNRTQAAELSARALREAACEKKNAVCVLMAQLHGLRVNVTLLKEQTLRSERAAVAARQRATTYMEVFSALPEYSQLPASGASGSADKTKKAADLAISAARKTKEGAEEVLASIAAYIAVLTKIFDSIACSDLVPSTDYDACGVAVGGVTEVSLASSVSKYITLQNVTATERVDERLVHLIEKWRAVLAMRKESVLHAESAVGHAAETEKMTMAGQKDTFCRAVDHLRGMTDFIIVLRERAQSGKLATAEVGAKLRVLEDSLESAKQKVASVEAMVKDAAAAVSSSGSAANEVRIASASVARAKAAADTSLTNANKAVEEVRNAKVIIDSSQRDVSSAHKIVAATNGTCSEVMMVLERVDSDLKSLETRLADAQKTLIDSATELSGDGAINMQSDCTVLRAAAPLESAEYRADVLALFSGPLYAAKLKTGVNNTLREFVRVIRDLESVEEAVQIVMENVEGASVHVISANARAAQAGDGATQARKMAELSAMESKKAQEEILSEEASAVCGLVRQLGSLKSQFTSLRKEALVRVQSVIEASTETDLPGDTEKLSVSNEHSRAKGTVELVGTPGSETARPPSTVAEAVEAADKAIKDISGLLEAVSKRLSSITVNMGDPKVDVSDCALFGGSVTEDSLMSAAARYARLVSSGGRLHTEGGLRDELVKWLRQLKACGETVLRTGGAEMKTSGMRMAPDTLDSTDATTSGPEAASEGDEARVTMSANTPVQDKSGNILTWILMSSTPLLLLVVLVFILIRRLGKQEKCEEFECIKQLPIARSRAESFEYISHVPSEAIDDALSKSCEIELDMAGGW